MYFIPHCGIYLQGRGFEIPFDIFHEVKRKRKPLELIKNGRGIRPDDAVATDSAQAGRMHGANSCPAHLGAGEDEEDTLTVAPLPLPII
jgi:hypothetical protein